MTGEIIAFRGCMSDCRFDALEMQVRAFQQVDSGDTAFNGWLSQQTLRKLSIYLSLHKIVVHGNSLLVVRATLVTSLQNLRSYVRYLIVPIMGDKTLQNHGMLRSSRGCGGCSGLQSAIRHILNHMRMHPSCIVLRRPAPSCTVL